MHSIRPGKKSDIPAIAQLLVDTWQSSYTDFMPSDFLDSLQVEKQIIRHNKYIEAGVQYFLAENAEKELLGFTSVGKNRMVTIDCAHELYTLYVGNDAQGQGIGTSLLNAVIKHIDDPQSSISVSVFETNAYKSFYLKNGFQVVGDEMINLGKFKLKAENMCKGVSKL